MSWRDFLLGYLAGSQDQTTFKDPEFHKSMSREQKRGVLIGIAVIVLMVGWLLFLGSF